MESYLELFRVDERSMVPKYMQVINLILEGIRTGKIKPGDGMPSLHEYCSHLRISKNTVEKAYNKLKKMQVLSAYKGKGFYVIESAPEKVASFIGNDI